MKLSKIAAAIGLVAAAPAFAAIGYTDTDTELWAVVFDENVGSYALDLGLTLDQFVGTPGLSFSKAVGPAYAQFVAADTNPSDGTAFDGTRWAIFAVDSQSFGSPGEAEGYRYLTTSNVGAPTPSVDNLTLAAGSGNVTTIESLINQTGTHTVDPAINGESFNVKGDQAAFVETNNGFSASAGFFAGNNVGVQSDLYYFYTSSFDPFEQSTRQLVGNASFDGTTFAVTAVPEPSTYALLLAGLLTVGFVARRRG